jgi:hypothetical protein
LAGEPSALNLAGSPSAFDFWGAMSSDLLQGFWRPTLDSGAPIADEGASNTSHMISESELACAYEAIE